LCPRWGERVPNKEEEKREIPERNASTGKRCRNKRFGLKEWGGGGFM